eukprot:9492640-Pyramimonas_sp.AAC.1
MPLDANALKYTTKPSSKHSLTNGPRMLGPWSEKLESFTWKRDLSTLALPLEPYITAEVKSLN